jgi:hypothetical protein
MLTRFFGYLLLCNLLLVATTVQANSKKHIGRESHSSNLDRLPLVFEENNGQFDNHVKFVARGSDYTVFLTSDQALLGVRAGNESGTRGPGTAGQNARLVRMTLIGANIDSPVRGLEQQIGKSNYLIGNDPRNWHSNIPHFGKVEYRGIYPGIDLVYYGQKGSLEYDFRLAPGADVGLLAMRFEGVSHLETTPRGDIFSIVGDGVVRLGNPNVYQERDGVRHKVRSHFNVRGTNEVSIALGNYDKNSALIIDPVLTYATLIPTNNNTQVQGIAVDSEGNIFIAGTTFATDYPTEDAVQTSNHGYTDAFITKLSPTGNLIIFSTYLGGSQFDNGRAVAVDAAGNAYLGGTVGSPDFPTTPGAFMSTCASAFLCNTPFVAKFSQDGHLIYSTLTGGSNNPLAGIAADKNGNAYITGTAAANDMPVVNAFEPNFPGLAAFVQKINPDGTALVYSTYFGTGSGQGTTGAGISVDSAGSAYIVGSTSGIPTKNPIQSGPIAFSSTAYIAKFLPGGSDLAYATYIGGSGGDSAVGVAVDRAGNAHVTGNSLSCDFPLTLHAFDATCANSSDDWKVFVLAVDATGSRLLFSTFLGGGYAAAIASDPWGNTFVDGRTGSHNFPTRKAVQSSNQASNGNGFVSEFDIKGHLIFSTYLGGQAGAEPAGIAVDDDQNDHSVYVTGIGQGDFPIVAPLPQKPSQSCCYSFFIAKINADTDESDQPQISLSPLTSPVLSLRNPSSTPLHISGITTSSNFTKGGDCGARIDPGSGCTLILEGTADQKTHGTVTISSDASAHPQTFDITKSPWGNTVGSVVTVTPQQLDFPAQFTGTPSAWQQVVITNVGLTPSSIDFVAVVAGEYTQTNDCPTMLHPPSFCTIKVQFRPANSSSGGGQLAVVVDQNRSTVYLNGSASSSAFLASTQALQYPPENKGSVSLERLVNFTNTTPYPAAIVGITTTQGFIEKNTCFVAVPPHGDCRAAVRFVPTANQLLTGSLTAKTYGPGGAKTVDLFATGLIKSSISVSPITLDFPQVFVGVPFGQPISVTNTAGKPVAIDNVSTSGPFSQSNTCVGTLAVGASCPVNVTFTPTTAGAVSGSLHISLGANGTSQVLSLTGTAITPLRLYPSPVVFEQQVVGTSKENALVMANDSNVAISINSIEVSGSDFSLSPNFCPAPLPPFIGCSFGILFKPSATGVRSGKITLSASDSSQPHVVQLQGIGVGPGALTLSLASVDFGVQALETASSPRTLTLSNTGTGPLHFGISASPQFLVSGSCAGTLAPGTSCSVSVRFAPTVPGILEGLVTVNDDSLGSPHTVSLTGIGTEPPELSGEASSQH